MKIALVLTNDWELFGDGSGDYFEIQHNPTLELLELLKEEGVKITLMAEVHQQLKHIQFSVQYPELNRIVDSWEKAILRTIELGNDVQMHIHPQWLDAKFNNSKWILDMNKSPISSLSEKEFRELISNAKSYLVNLIKAKKSDYQCLAFRAGNYLIQPSEKAVKILLEAGFKVDTSVTKELYSKGNYDYRNAYSNFIPWYANPDDINLVSQHKNTLIEFPIYSIKNFGSPILRKKLPIIYHKIKYCLKLDKNHIIWQNEKEKIKDMRYPKSIRYYKRAESKDLAWYVSKILCNETIQLDYDHLYPEIFIKIILGIFKNPLAIQFADNYQYVPIIASGHIKDIHNLKNIKMIIRLLSSELNDRLEFWTITQAYNYFKNKL